MTATLLVTIDTEEEFDWCAPFSSDQRSVSHVKELPRLQDLFEEFGVRPTYVVDHPIATTDESIDVLRGFFDRDACEIGAHVHPWVSPPIEEEITLGNSYLCNLPLSLQQQKVEVLTDAIHAAFGHRPTSFKAGRYGIDFRLIPFLQSLGYQVDNSVMAFFDDSDNGGPNFSDFGHQPFWLTPPLVAGATGDQPMLEIPCTVGFTRRPFRLWSRVHRVLSQDRFRLFRPIGLLWHLQVLRKVVLSPEGTDVSDQIKLLEVLGAERDVVINLTLHSPSIEPGNTAYVQSQGELEEFMSRLRATLDFATSRLGARCMTLTEFSANYKHTLCQQPRQKCA